MDLEVRQQIGAERYERSDKRTTQPNGYRERTWETRLGEIDLPIPPVRQGSSSPSWLEPRRRAEQALLAAIQQTYLEGVRVRRVADLLKALGLTGIEKSAGSRISQQLDGVVEQFRLRPLQGAYPYLWLDALSGKGRQKHRFLKHAVVIGIGVRETREREIVGLAGGHGRKRHAAWSSCAAGHQRQEVGPALQARWPQAAKVLVEAEEEVLAYMAFPRAHWTRIFSTNVLERLNRAVKRRMEGVGVFPDVPSVIRLVGVVLLQIDDEWPIERRYLSLESMQKRKEPLAEQVTASRPLRLAPVRCQQSNHTEKYLTKYTIDKDAIFILSICSPLRPFHGTTWTPI